MKEINRVKIRKYYQNVKTIYKPAGATGAESK